MPRSGAEPTSLRVQPASRPSSGDSFTASWRIVTWAGLLGSVYYILCVTGVPRIKFLTELGATAFDFGLITALGAFALVFQLLGGMLANRLHTRKRLWILLAVLHRSAFLGVAIAPFLPVEPRLRVLIIVAVLFVHDALAQTSVPLWLSWMADLVPQESITRHWANRQRFITLANIAVMIGVALGFHGFEVNGNIVGGYVLLAVAGVVLGVIDILMFAWVVEPLNERIEQVAWRSVVAQPFRDPQYRPFLWFMGYWHFALFFAAPFFGLYMVDFLALSVLTVQLLGAVGVLGVAVSSRFWGILGDTYGYRPLLQLLSVGKAFTPLMFLVTPAATSATVPILALVMFVDGVLNSGLMLTFQGVMLKNTPRRNRTMYIAATNFLALGLMAGIVPVAAGQCIDWLNAPPRPHWGWYELSGYHAAFAASFVLQIPAYWVAGRVYETKMIPARTVLAELVSPTAYTVTRLVYRLQHAADAQVRLDAAEVLGRLRRPLAIVELIHRLQDPDRHVREAAAEALGNIGMAEASQPLAQALFDSESGIQGSAAQALGRIGGVDSLRALLAGLRRQPAGTLRASIDALVRIGDDAAILPLICLFHDLDDEVIRRDIADGLAKLTRSDSLEDVLQLLHGRRPPDQINVK